MNKVLIGIVFASITLCFACKKETRSFPVAVDLQSQFNNDNVNVYIDNVLVFGKIITTNDVLSLAASTSKTLKEGQHEIKVFVNSKTLNQSFNLDSDLYIGINYNRDSSTISLRYWETPFIYE
jgi:hypothetical protein